MTDNAFVSLLLEAALPAPKRERGRVRVAAIMQTAVDVFTEKGYDAATMTEIAARSGTAIGSMYRFFPSKEALADALLVRYAQQVAGGLAELETQVPGMSADALAGALVDFILALKAQRSFAVSLVDARGGSDARRRRFRESVRGGLARVLLAMNGGLAPAKAQTTAVVLLHLLKGVMLTEGEAPAAQALLLGEVRELVRLYLASVRMASGDRAPGA
ncbi:TetR/AcrR family transcriptional regulator [Burkholderia sp. WAC0059]|uniref:TetR/AcrR family transcriptional regulator n=1 Tax=Burkholderia sp. WAC0059 TaxID=2066022 RepID=UPI000C7F6067|nr:TetR/AcrR family transcriptional regulator [Burkholderia sp. WAC0059]PLZ04276.1 TetR/AcrR family transcriptional regulator [Burkholderia sp. WAC0059]